MKQNVIPFPTSVDECVIVKAEVEDAAGGSVRINTGERIVQASVAFGCLVEPVAGDQVLVSCTGGEYYVLSVLVRKRSQDMALAFPGHVKLNVPRGNLEFISREGLNLITSGKTAVLSAETVLSSGKVSVNADQLATRTRDLESYTQNAKIFATEIDTMAERVSQRAKTLMRWVEGVETLSIGQLIQNVRKTLISRSDQAVMSAKKDLRVDAERIHMG